MDNSSTIFPLGIPTERSPATTTTDPIVTMGLAELRDHARQLAKRLDRQGAALAALTEIVRELARETEPELLSRLQTTIERQRQAAVARACEQCGRRLAAKKLKCMYCGALTPASSVADLL
jgi:hypothetical protein